jgi:hypothetical protein
MPATKGSTTADSLKAVAPGQASETGKNQKGKTAKTAGQQVKSRAAGPNREQTLSTDGLRIQEFGGCDQ